MSTVVEDLIQYACDMVKLGISISEVYLTEETYKEFLKYPLIKDGSGNLTMYGPVRVITIKREGS